jgi:hypothetical protein
MSKRGWLKWTAIWKASDDVEVELMRIERKVANCLRRFSVSWFLSWFNPDH